MHSFVVISFFLISVASPFFGLLTLIAGFFVGDRVFAHFHFSTPFAPIYVTEAVILGACLNRLRTLVPQFKKPLIKSGQLIWALLILVVAQSLVRGLFNPNYPFPIVMRDFAMAYYFFLFIFLADMKLTPLHWKISGIALILILLVQSVLLLMGNLISVVRFSQSAALAMYLSLTLLMLVSFEIQKRWLNRLRYLCLVLFSTAISFLMVRTSWLALAIILFFLSWMFRYSSWSRTVFIRLGAILLTGYLMCLCIATLPSSQISTAAIKNEVLSFTQGKQSPNVLTRFNMWIEAFEQVTGTGLWSRPPSVYRLLKDPKDRLSETGIAKYYANPSPTAVSDEWTEILIPPLLEPGWLRTMFGIPFGHPYLPLRCNIQTSRFDPHNSYVAWFYRMGVIGLILFLIFLIVEIRKTLNFIERSTGNQRFIAIGLLLGMIYCMGHALSDVTFENAYKGIFLAVFIGILRSMRRSNVILNQSI